MKGNKSILVLIYFICSFIVKAEEYPTFSIVELSFYADTVVEARFLKKVNEDYLFLIGKFNQDKNYDTLTISRINELFDESVDNHSYWFPRQYVTFETCDKLLIYLSRNSSNALVPVFSGYRLLKDNFIYAPFQPENPGKFSFAKSAENISWDELLTRVQRVNTRIQNVKKIKNISDPHLRNHKLFNWIDQNKSSFGKNCVLDDDCGWGSIEWEVFEWITEVNIAQDTWNASQLFREVNSQSDVKWIRDERILRDVNDKSFTTYDDIDFLLNISLDVNKTIDERYQALQYLCPASRKVYEDNYPKIPDSNTLAFQNRKQKSIRADLMPLLNDVNLKEPAFQVIKGLSNPIYGHLNHRIDLEVMPIIIRLYKREKPSKYRSELAEFIVRNVKKTEWKKLTNCEENIFVDLNQLYVDIKHSTLALGILYNYGKEPINEIPIIEIQDLASKKLVLQINSHEFKLPYEKSNGQRELSVDIKGLDKGKYKVYVKGKAGEESIYNWVSEYGEFEIK